MSLCNERAALSYMGNESRRYYGCQLINSPPSRNARNGLPLCGRVHLYMYNCVSVGLDLDYITKRLMVNTRDPYYLLRYNIRGVKTD